MGLRNLTTRDPEGSFHAVVETPRGAAAKIKFDQDLGVLILSRPLALGLQYPYDWGFIAGTLAPDGDPLDVMILWDTPTYPGLVIPSRAIGVVKLEQDKKSGRGRERNDRVIAMPTKAPRVADIRDVDDLPRRLRDEIGKFFVDVTFFADKNAKVLGWGNAAEAEKLIDQLTIKKRRRTPARTTPLPAAAGGAPAAPLPPRRARPPRSRTTGGRSRRRPR